MNRMATGFKALEETSVVEVVFSARRECRCGKLFGVSYENAAATLKSQWDQAFQFHRLQRGMDALCDTRQNIVQEGVTTHASVVSDAARCIGIWPGGAEGRSGGAWASRMMV